MINLEPLFPNHVKDVCNIKQYVSENGWNEIDLIMFLDTPGCYGSIARDYDKAGHPIIGYVLFQGCDEELEIIDIKVSIDHRRKGICSTLIWYCQRMLNGRKMFAEVRGNNYIAHKFFRNLGFNVVKVIDDAYDDAHMECLVFQYTGAKKRLTVDLKNRISDYV